MSKQHNTIFHQAEGKNECGKTAEIYKAKLILIVNCIVLALFTVPRMYQVNCMVPCVPKNKDINKELSVSYFPHECAQNYFNALFS